MELGKVICVPDADGAAARDAAMAASVTAELAEAPELPGIATGCVDAGSPHAGRLFVQGTAGGAPFDDVHGPGWRLVTTATDVGLDGDLAVWFASIGGSVITVDDDEHTRWFAATGTTAVLERPDFHVFGTAANPAEAADLVARLRHHLRPVPATTGSAP